MKKVILKIVCFIGFLLVSNSMLSQNPKFFVGIGGNAKHAFPKSNASENLSILGYSGTISKTYVLEPGYELSLGFRFSKALDLLLGINYELWNLHSSPYRYELNFVKINYPFQLRYHYGHQDDLSNIITFGVNLGKILQRELSRDRSTWQHDYLEDWNNVDPLSLSLGVGKIFSITQNSSLLINPFVSYELSNNKIINGFYTNLLIGVKISHELNFSL